MENFNYNDLKKASINKDFSKVPSLGPYAYTLTKILNQAFCKKLENNKYL
jgi:hypothetical protein